MLKSDPPQPPTIKLQNESPTGTVRPQKKSDPPIRIASNATSKFILGKSFVQLMPVNGSPMFKTISPASHCTSPRPANSVSRQPVRVLPSNIGCQSSPSSGAEGFAAACCKVSFGVPGGLAGVAALCGRDAWVELEGFTGAELHPANNIRTNRRAVRAPEKVELFFIS